MENETALEPSLGELLSTDTLKWIFVGGKGGVGKTTTACSVAIQLSKVRTNVLILSTDPAHNLSDALKQKFSNQPTKVNGFENLFAMEVEASVAEKVGFQYQEEGGIGSLLKDLPQLMSALPGMDETMSFAELMHSVQSMTFSTIVFDTAPTGHTLRLLSFPDFLEKALTKLVDLRQKMAGAFSMINSMTGGSVDENELQEKIDGLRSVTSSVRATFQDPSKCQFVCVCIPEFLSVYETERLVQELAKQSIDCSNIVVNQVLYPVDKKAIGDETFDQICKGSDENQRRAVEEIRDRLRAVEGVYSARRKMQAKYLLQIRDLYSYDFHVACMQLQNEEVRGVEGLEAFGSRLTKLCNMDKVLESNN